MGMLSNSAAKAWTMDGRFSLETEPSVQASSPTRRKFVPRLSIIIPHQSDSQLENSLLSVLEHRPQDCEVIVPHDGSYLDPYQLTDEVVYVQEDPQTSTIQLLNAGLYAACAPVVCVLLDGALVTEDAWYEKVSPFFSKHSADCVSPRIQYHSKAINGIDLQAINDVRQLRNGRVDTSSAKAALMPKLTCAFYRRRTLLAIGGWCESLSLQTADIELALALKELKVSSAHQPECVIQCAEQPERVINKTTRFELGGIAVAHGLVQNSILGLIATTLVDCLTGKLGAGLAWSSGVLNTQASEKIAERLAHAHQQLKAEPALRVFNGSADTAQTWKRKVA